MSRARPFSAGLLVPVGIGRSAAGASIVIGLATAARGRPASDLEGPRRDFKLDRSGLDLAKKRQPFLGLR